MLIKCDGDNGCGKAFKHRGFEMRRIGNGIEKTFFTCPLCNEEYVSFYTNENIRTMQKRIKKLQQEPNPTMNILKKIDKLFLRVKQEMDILKQTMEVKDE